MATGKIFDNLNSKKFFYFKETKHPYAVKIVDVTTERQSEKEAKLALEEALSEVKLLKKLSGHPSIGLEIKKNLSFSKFSPFLFCFNSLKD